MIFPNQLDQIKPRKKKQEGPSVIQDDFVMVQP